MGQAKLLRRCTPPQSKQKRLSASCCQPRVVLARNVPTLIRRLLYSRDTTAACRFGKTGRKRRIIPARQIEIEMPADRARLPRPANVNLCGLDRATPLRVGHGPDSLLRKGEREWREWMGACFFGGFSRYYVRRFQVLFLSAPRL